MKTQQNGKISFSAGKESMQIAWAIAAFAGIPFIALMIKGLFVLDIFFLFIIVGALHFIRTSYRDYYEILLYDDGLRSVDISGKTIWELYFRDIKSVGFLHSGFYRSRGFSHSRVRAEELILLLHDGGKVVIDGHMSNVHQLCGIIQQKITG